MSLDKDIDVTVEAVELVVQLANRNPDSLTNTECEHLYLQTYSVERRVGRAAGVFLRNLLEERGRYGEQPDTRSSRGKPRRPASLLLRHIISNEVELKDHEKYLEHCCPELMDWEAMVDLLAEEPGPGEETLQLGDTEAPVAAALLAASVQQAVERQPPRGRGGERRVLPPREQDLGREAREAATACLLPALPGLLDRRLPAGPLHSDRPKVTNMVPMISHNKIGIR